jgi:cytoskeletal protein CcmA (bactofilin family)
MLRISAWLFIFLMVPAVVSASSVVRTGTDVGVAVDQAVEGDFYGLAESVAMSGEVTEDLLVAAVNLTINGQVGADVAALSGTVDVDGVSGDDVRIVAGEVTVKGQVDGDLVVVGGTLKVLSTAKINGDILFFGGEADIAGQVGKSIYGVSETIRVDGVVGGDIDIKTTKLTLGDRSDVTGAVKYVSLNELVRAQNARVGGKITKNDPINVDTNNPRDLVVLLLVVLFAALVWYLLFGRLLEKVVDQSVGHSLRSMLIGFGIVILLPIAAAILLLSTLGSILGLTLLFMYAAVVLMAVTVSGIIAGVYLERLFNKKRNINLLVVIFGTVSLFIVSVLPLIGPAIFMGVFLITLGALTTHLYRSLRFV